MTEIEQKYIIRNCPCAKWRMGQPSKVFCIEDEEYKTLCKDVGNCTIKQIVEKCESIDADCFDQWCFANYILESLEIEKIK